MVFALINYGKFFKNGFVNFKTKRKLCLSEHQMRERVKDEGEEQDIIQDFPGHILTINNG